MPTAAAPSEAGEATPPPRAALALQWRYDVLAEPDAGLVNTCVRVLRDYLGEAAGCVIPEANCRAFVEEIRVNMSTAWVDQVPLYHNFKHGADVLLQVAHYMFVCGAREMLTPLDMLALGVAAIAHDVSHPGLNNAYQVNAQTWLAVRYSDAAVLEAHSAAVVSDLARAHGLLAGLGAADFRRARNVICASILGTDMASHFKTMQRLEAFCDAHAGPRVVLEAEERKFLCDVLLHCADVSNPARPWAASKKWSDLVCAEFFLQGDREAAAGLPISPNCNRRASQQPQLAMAFGDHIVQPLFQLAARLLPSLEATALADLTANRKHWAARRHWAALRHPDGPADAPPPAFGTSAGTSDAPPTAADEAAAETDAAALSPVESAVEPPQMPPPADGGGSASPARQPRLRRGLSLSEAALDVRWQRTLTPTPRDGAGVFALPSDGAPSDAADDETRAGCEQRLVPADGAPADERPALGRSPSQPRRLFDGADAAAPHPRGAVRWASTLAGPVAHFLLLVVGVAALVGDAARRAWLPVSADAAVDAFLATAGALLICEVALRAATHSGGAFEAVVDAAGALSLIVDASAVRFAVAAVHGAVTTARTVQFARFCSCCRLARVARLAKFDDGSEAAGAAASGISPAALKGDPRSPGAQPRSAALGARLAERMSRSMVAVVLLVALVAPAPARESDEAQIALLRALRDMPHAARTAFVADSYAETFDVLALRVAGVVFVPEDHARLAALRANEVARYSAGDDGGRARPDGTTEVLQDVRRASAAAAAGEVFTLSLLAVLLAAASWGFRRAASDAVVRPVRRLLRLAAEVARALDVLQCEASVETDLLDHSIGKVAELLRLGFGAAGLGDAAPAVPRGPAVSRFVAVDIEAAFAFVDFHSLAHVALEELRPDVARLYVDLVVHVVRAGVDACGGVEARRAGTAFLLVWRTAPSADVAEEALAAAPRAGPAPRAKRPSWTGPSDTDAFPGESPCDCAFRAVVLAGLDAVHLNETTARDPRGLAQQLAAMNFPADDDDMNFPADDEDDASPVGIARRLSEAMARRLGRRADLEGDWRGADRAAATLERDGCALAFAAGLHFGAAVEHRSSEGTPTFLSPHVRVASRLGAAAAAVYGAPLLMSGPFVERLAPETRAMVRHVDRAKLRGVEKPLALHAYDFLPADAAAETPADAAAEAPATEAPAAEAAGPAAVVGGIAGRAYALDFRRGVAAYLDGDWALAYQIFDDAPADYADDAPARAIVDFMASHGNICPADWRGYRTLP